MENSEIISFYKLIAKDQIDMRRHIVILVVLLYLLHCCVAVWEVPRELRSLPNFGKLLSADVSVDVKANKELEMFLNKFREDGR